MALMDATDDDWTEVIKRKLSLREMLDLYRSLSGLPRTEEESRLRFEVFDDEQRTLISYVLSFGEEAVAPVVSLIDDLDERASRLDCKLTISDEEFRTLHKAFASIPPQLHSSIFSLLDAERAAVAHALMIMPVAEATILVPYILPVLLARSSDPANAAVAGVLANSDACKVPCWRLVCRVARTLYSSRVLARTRFCLVWWLLRVCLWAVMRPRWLGIDLLRGAAC